MTARITVTGNAATPPLVRVTKTGRRVANFRIGSNERYQDRESGEWVDGSSFFVSVACWGALADNVEKSVKLGMGLIVTGKISQRTYTDADDKTQFAYEIQADTVAPDLNRGTVVFTKVSRNAGPSITVDAEGNPPLGVFDDPFGRPGGSARGDGSLTVRSDGGFGRPGGADLAPEHDEDDAARERDDAELVGAAR